MYLKCWYGGRKGLISTRFLFINWCPFQEAFDGPLEHRISHPYRTCVVYLTFTSAGWKPASLQTHRCPASSFSLFPSLCFIPPFCAWYSPIPLFPFIPHNVQLPLLLSVCLTIFFSPLTSTSLPLFLSLPFPPPPHVFPSPVLFLLFTQTHQCLQTPPPQLSRLSAPPSPQTPPLLLIPLFSPRISYFQSQIAAAGTPNRTRDDSGSALTGCRLTSKINK